eukprot:234105_1
MNLNGNLFGVGGIYNVTVKHLIETFGNENPRLSALLPPLYNERQTYSSSMTVSQKDKNYFNTAIKKLQRKGTLTTAKTLARKPTLIQQNQHINDTLSLYGQLLREVFNNPSLLSPIYYDPAYKYLGPIVGLLTETLVSNQFDEAQEHILTSIMEDIMQFEFNATEDLTTYLRENTAATKLLGAYLKREPVAIFVNEIVEEACAFCLKNYQEDLEIDPSAIWEKEMNNLSTQVSLKGPEDPSIEKLCKARRATLKRYIDFILDKIMNANRYPIGLRIVCKKLKELAVSKDPKNERLRNSLIGGFIFLRIFNPKIAYYGKLKSQHEQYKKYAGSVRRKFTLISKILQNISNQVPGGTKEKWMASMNDYIMSKCKKVSKFFGELTDIPPLAQFFALDERILCNTPKGESIYISIQDLKLLTTMIYEDKKKKTTRINTANKRYYGLIEQIIARKMFSKIPDTDGIQPHAMINVPKKKTRFNINKVHVNNSDDKSVGHLELNLKIKVIPVLRELWGRDQLMDYLFALKPKDLVSDTINFLRFAAQTQNVADVRNATNVLINYHNPKITKELLVKLYEQSNVDMKIFTRLSAEVQKMKKYQAKLDKEVQHLSTNFNRIKREQEKAAELAKQQHGRGRKRGKGLDGIFKLINARNQHQSGNKKGNYVKGKKGSQSEQKQMEMNVELTENIVAVDGMIGNMLVTLVRDVGQALAKNMKENPKLNSEKYVQLWSEFPQNVPSYFPIIQRVARLGKMCMRELISTIIEADQANARSRDPTKRFKFTTLHEHIKNIGNNDHNKQICNYVIDFMMVDTLQHCMKWIAPGGLYVTDMKGKFNMFHNQVNNKCIQKLQTIRHNKLGSDLSSKWKLKRLRKWGVLISILSPTYPEAVVDGFQICYDNIQTDADGFLFGASYIKFKCDNVSVPTMQAYFDWIYKLIVANKGNPEKLKLIMVTLEHNIRALNVNNDIHGPVFILKIQNQCFMELYRILANRRQQKSDILNSPFRRLRSSFLCRRPGFVDDPDKERRKEWKAWLESLSNFKLTEKKNLPKASDLLHFLRAGGSSWDEAITRQNRKQILDIVANNNNNYRPNGRKNTAYMQGYGGITDDGNPILEQAYGRVEPRLQLNSTYCKILCDKLFKSSRKYDRQKQAVTIFLLSACAIQLCVHHFSHAITNVIQLFLSKRDVSVERYFIAVYALNFICLPECKFAEFMRVKIVGAKQHQSQLAAREAWHDLSTQLNESKRKLHPQIRGLFEYLGKMVPINSQKNILTEDDARKKFSAEALEAQDEKLMFQDHVRKMLIFDWTATPMSEYMLPILHIETELLIYCLRLAPHIECEELWEDTERNCSISGSFIGKWILHKDERVREQVLRTLLVAMKDPSKRSAVMQCFIEMLMHHDWRASQCLIMLLKTVTHLLDHYRKLVVLDEESKKRGMQMNHQYGKAEEKMDDVPLVNDDPLRQGRELPQWFAWQNRADALGLVLLCHHNIQVRLHALEFLNKITDIYREFTGVGGGSVYIQKHTVQQMSNKLLRNGSIHVVDEHLNNDMLGERTVGGLIATHGRSIARMATMKYDNDRNSDSGRRSSTLYSQPQTANIVFSQCIHQWGLIPFCISQLAKRIVNSHLHETILNVVDVLLYSFGFMQPHIAATKDKTGWSTAQDWQASNPLQLRGHWISLHTLFFSLIGAGLSNPFSISSSKDLDSFRSDTHNLGSKSYALTTKQFEGYLTEFWHCLYEESPWVREAVNSIILETNWEAIPIVVGSLNNTYHAAVRKRRRGKNIISDTVYLLKNLAEIVKFPAGVFIGGEKIVELCFRFVNGVKTEAFRPDRIDKKKWWHTQTELAEFYGYFLRALSKIGAHAELRTQFWVSTYIDNKNHKSINEIRSLWSTKSTHSSSGPFKKDPMPHVKGSKTVDRFGMFKWLLQFLVDVDSIVTPFVEPADMKQQKHRTAQVRRAVFQGLQYLLNMGCVIPTHQLKQDNYIINLLRGAKGIDPDFTQNYSLASSSKNKCILQVFIEAENEKFQVLTPLLTFQFESLISFYIEQASTHQNAAHLFFRAIVNVIEKNHGVQRLTAVESGYGKNDWKIKRNWGNGFLESVFHYAHKLLFLGFIMIIEPLADTRYSGYLLLRSMADILVGDRLVVALDKLKFAFESSMSLWVRKNGILISSYFAQSYPTLGSLLFRVCIQYAEDKDRAEWISAFLKPWAKTISLIPETKVICPEYVHKYNEKYVESSAISRMVAPQVKAKSKKTHQYLKHQTFVLLSTLFSSTVDAKDDLQTSFLKVWTDLSQAFPYDNLFAILDFVFKKVQNTKLQVTTTIIPTVKNIFFAIYEPPLNRAIMTVYIIRNILAVLKIGAEDYRQKGLVVKERAAAILTTLEDLLARKEENDHLTTLNYDIHHEILGYNTMNDSSKAAAADALPRYRHTEQQHQRLDVGRHRTSQHSQSIPVAAAGGGGGEEMKTGDVLSIGEKRASIAAALLVELIGVDCEPIKPYFPVLVLYGALYIDKPGNHASMHNLLVRLITTLSTTQTIEEIERKTHSSDDNKPSLAAALTSRTLELLWDEDVDGASKKQFVHNQGDYVAIDGATFVREYCSQFEAVYKPNLRTGYEALRWAVLSTNPEITTRSFHIYRQLLNPLNHCTVKVMLLALCGAIDNWEASERELTTYSGSISVSHAASYSNHTMQQQQQQQQLINIETQRILGTIIRMAEKLKEKNELYEYDSLVWTGIALLRADVKIEGQKQVFKKGLELLNIVLDDEDLSLQYLFVNAFAMNKANKMLRRPQQQQQQKEEHPQQQQQRHAHFNTTQHTTAGGPQLAISSSGAGGRGRRGYEYKEDATPRHPQAQENNSSSHQWMDDDYKYGSQQTTAGGPNEPDFVWNALDEYDYDPSDSDDDDNILFSGTTLGGPIEYSTNNNNNNLQRNNNTPTATPSGATSPAARHNKTAADSRSQYDIYSNDLAESFLTYCIDWAPPFQGIHPYLLQGLLQNDIEDATFRVLKKVLTTKMDKLGDRSSARPCLCIVAVLPYMYYIIRHKPEYFATISHSLFESLILLTSQPGLSGNYNPYGRLNARFIYWSNCPINLEKAGDLLKEFCALIVCTFFAEHAGLVANYLNALLNSPRMAHHHTTVYKMSALFLGEDANYIEAFYDVIVSAHKMVSEKVDKTNLIAPHFIAPQIKMDSEDMSEMADAATELVATGINYLKEREKQRFTKKFHAGDFESTAGGGGGGGSRPHMQQMNNNNDTPQTGQIIRWDVHLYINDITPFPQTGLKDVSNALWGVVKETRAVV